MEPSMAVMLTELSPDKQTGDTMSPPTIIATTLASGFRSYEAANFPSTPYDRRQRARVEHYLLGLPRVMLAGMRNEIAYIALYAGADWLRDGIHTSLVSVWSKYNGLPDGKRVRVYQDDNFLGWTEVSRILPPT